MGKQSKHFEGLQETFDGLRSIVKASDVYARPTRSLIVGTSAAIIITLPFILFQLLKTKQKKTRLIATSSRSTLDYLGRFLGDVCAFIIFPLFVFNIVGLWVNVGIDKIYDGKILTVGYFIHSGSGALYLITGGLQFYTPLRQRYPKIHRFLGYVYYSMSLITAVGVTIMAYKPSGGLTSQLGVLTFLPPWVLVNILAFRAIVFFRDVELHRQLNILGLSVASSIILMRPLSVVLLLLDMEMLFVESMGLSFWIGFVWSIFAAILYIIHVYTLPTARFPRLQHSGEVRIDGSAHIAVEGMICGAVRIVSFRTLDLRTLHLKLSTKTHRAVHQAAFPISFPPGSHVSLKVGDIVREFTPINSDVKHGEIEIVVRLVPGGPFSNLISSSLDLNSSEVSNSEWNECYLDCSIYGPLLPLPSKFGYRPYFSAGECGNDDPLRPTLIMIGAGSGAMPFLSVIEAALKNKEDKTLLKLLSLSGASKQSDSDKKTDFGTFMQDKINQLQLPTKAGTGTDPVHGRFVGVNQRERFALSMLDSWIQDPLKSKRTDASAVLAAATDRMIVWVCGPPGFGEQCRSALVKGKGFHREQIFVLGADDR